MVPLPAASPDRLRILVILLIFYAQMDVMPQYPARAQGIIGRFHYFVDPPFDPK